MKGRSKIWKNRSLDRQFRCISRSPWVYRKTIQILKFVEWLYANQDRLEEALAELDIEIKPGWGVHNFRQFKELVKSKL